MQKQKEINRLSETLISRKGEMYTAEIKLIELLCDEDENVRDLCYQTLIGLVKTDSVFLSATTEALLDFERNQPQNLNET